MTQGLGLNPPLAPTEAQCNYAELNCILPTHVYAEASRAALQNAIVTMCWSLALAEV